MIMRKFSKVIFFIGPPKTGTTWFFYQLNKNPEVKIFNKTKDFYYSEKDKKKIKLKIDEYKKKYKLIVFFNHDFFHLRKFDLIKLLNASVYIIYRDSYERLTSTIFEGLKVGELNLNDVLNAKSLQDLPSLYKNYLTFENLSYTKIIEYLNFVKLRYHIINFKHLKTDQTVIFNHFINSYKLKNYFEKDVVINSKSIYLFPFLVKNIGTIIKKILYLFGFDHIWTKIKLYIMNIEFLKKSIPGRVNTKVNNLVKNSKISNLLNDDDQTFLKNNSLI